MNDETIEGINPLIISTFSRRKFKRYKMHPYINVLVRRKYPFWSRVPIVNLFLLYDVDDIFGVVRHPYFAIYGADGSRLIEITCRSNDDLKVRADQAEQKLNNFLSKIQGELK